MSSFSRHTVPPPGVRVRNMKHKYFPVHSTPVSFAPCNVRRAQCTLHTSISFVSMMQFGVEVCFTISPSCQTCTRYPVGSSGVMESLWLMNAQCETASIVLYFSVHPTFTLHIRPLPSLTQTQNSSKCCDVCARAKYFRIRFSAFLPMKIAVVSRNDFACCAHLLVCSQQILLSKLSPPSLV